MPRDVENNPQTTGDVEQSSAQIADAPSQEIQTEQQEPE